MALTQIDKYFRFLIPHPAGGPADQSVVSAVVAVVDQFVPCYSWVVILGSLQEAGNYGKYPRQVTMEGDNRGTQKIVLWQARTF